MAFHSYCLHHYYIKPLSFILKHTKTPLSSLLLSSRKLSSLVISWSSWDSRYWVWLTLPLLTPLFLHLYNLQQKSPPSPYWSCMKVLSHSGAVSHSGDSTRDIEGYASIRLWWPTMSSFVYLFLYIICLICHYIAWHASFAWMKFILFVC